MSYGRDNDGLPGQSRGGQRRNEPSFPVPSSGAGQRKRMPGGKAGGGGMMMLLIIGAVFFFMMRGAGGQNQQNPQDKNGIENQQKPGDMSSQPWRSDRNRQDEQPNRNKPQFDIGQNGGKDKSDRVESGDGWSIEDAKPGEGENDRDNFKFSDRSKKQPEKPDGVKNEDGWEVNDVPKKKK